MCSFWPPISCHFKSILAARIVSYNLFNLSLCVHNKMPCWTTALHWVAFHPPEWISMPWKTCSTHLNLLLDPKPTDDELLQVANLGSRKPNHLQMCTQMHSKILGYFDDVERWIVVWSRGTLWEFESGLKTEPPLLLLCSWRKFHLSLPLGYPHSTILDTLVQSSRIFNASN